MPGVTSSYIGIDQSLRSTGIAVIRNEEIHFNLIQPEDSIKEVERLAYIRNEIKDFLNSYGPYAHACIEAPSYDSTNRADDLGQLRGIILLALYDWEIPATTIPPSVLKKFGARHGNASKENMIKYAEAEFNVKLGHQDDIADALWLAKLAKALNEDIILTRPQLEVVYGIRNPKPKKRTLRTPRVLDI